MLYKCGAYFDIIHRFDEKREWLRAVGHILHGFVTKDNHRRCTMHRFVKYSYVTQGLVCLVGTQNRMRKIYKNVVSRKNCRTKTSRPPTKYIRRFCFQQWSSCLATLSFILLTRWFISSLSLGYLVHNSAFKYLNASFSYDSFMFLSIRHWFLVYISRACSPTNKTHTAWTGHLVCTFD
jgi:hypothetical protein